MTVPLLTVLMHMLVLAMMAASYSRASAITPQSDKTMLSARPHPIKKALAMMHTNSLRPSFSPITLPTLTAQSLIFPNQLKLSTRVR